MVTLLRALWPQAPTLRGAPTSPRPRPAATGAWYPCSVPSLPDTSAAFRACAPARWRDYPGAHQAQGEPVDRVHGHRRHGARLARHGALAGARCSARSASRWPRDPRPRSTTCSTGASTSRWRAPGAAPCRRAICRSARPLLFASTPGARLDAGALADGRRAHGATDFFLPDRLCHRLHAVAEARDAAEHRHRRRGRRGPAGARLGRGHQHHRSARAAAVPDHLHVDAAAFLGARRSRAATTTRRSAFRCCPSRTACRSRGCRSCSTPSCWA